jgi:predicted nucleic acid-binding Zn ribbon protein
MRSDRQRKQFTGGRWTLERERHQLADVESPTKFQDPSSMGALVAGIMKRLGLEAEHWVGLLEQEWPKLVGDAVAKHTRPGRFENKRLTVFVDSSPWLAELSRYGKTQMLQNLQARFGGDKIQSVHMQMDPDGGRPVTKMGG